VLESAKGFFGRKKNVWTVAKNAVEKGLTYAYRDRKAKKRDYRSLWIVRINAACRASEISYSKFMHGLKAAGMDLNRKVLADIAYNDDAAFRNLAELAKSALAVKESARAALEKG
jgi:large subunit ribosomal protein L20